MTIALLHSVPAAEEGPQAAIGLVAIYNEGATALLRRGAAETSMMQTTVSRVESSASRLS
jgi:hypothetical protein